MRSDDHFESDLLGNGLYHQIFFPVVSEKKIGDLCSLLIFQTGLYSRNCYTLLFLQRSGGINSLLVLIPSYWIILRLEIRGGESCHTSSHVLTYLEIRSSQSLHILSHVLMSFPYLSHVPYYLCISKFAVVSRVTC